MTPATHTPIGERSTLFLVYAYQGSNAGISFDIDELEQQLCAADEWQPKRLDDTALLPHLTTISDGKVLRRYTVGSALGNLFGEREGMWRLGSASAPLEVRVCDPPTVHVFETGYVFISIGVQPAAFDLASYQDTLHALVRRGMQQLGPDSLPEKARTWTARKKIDAKDLRGWLAALVPGLSPEIPAGGRHNPISVGVVFTTTPLDAAERHRLRLAHASEQDVAPSERDQQLAEHPSIWRPSAHETCLFSPFGVQWIVDPQSEFLRERLLPTVRSSYLYKWMLVAHQRLVLLRLTSSANEISKRRHARGADSLRVALLQYTAEYNFGHISDEERHDEFYRALRNALDIEGLFREAKEEITEIHEHAGARQAERLNRVLAFLTVVLTPIGLVIGIFQDKTLPWQPFELSSLFTASGWADLLGHGPFQLLLLCAVLGTAIFLFFRTDRGLDDLFRRRRPVDRSKSRRSPR